MTCISYCGSTINVLKQIVSVSQFRKTLAFKQLHFITEHSANMLTLFILSSIFFHLIASSESRNLLTQFHVDNYNCSSFKFYFPHMLRDLRSTARDLLSLMVTFRFFQLPVLSVFATLFFHPHVSFIFVFSSFNLG